MAHAHHQCIVGQVPVATIGGGVTLAHQAPDGALLTCHTTIVLDGMVGFGEFLTERNAAEERGVVLLVDLRLQACRLGTEFGFGVDAHQLGGDFHHLIGHGVDLTFEHRNVDAVPQPLHHGNGALAVGLSDHGQVGMPRKYAAKIFIVHRLEVRFVSIFPKGAAVFHLRADVAKNQSHGSLFYLLVVRQLAQRVEHSGVVAVKRKSRHTTRRGLPRRIAGAQPHEGHVDRTVVVDAHRHHRPRLHIVGLATAGRLAHVGPHIGHFPRAGFVFDVVPFARQRLLSFIELVVAEHAHVDAHVFEHLGHEARFARGIVEEASAEIIAGRNGDVIGINAFERIESLHHPSRARHLLGRIRQETCMEIIERKDRHRDGVAIGCMERTTGRSQTGKQERSGQKRVFHDDLKFKQGTRPAAPAEALTRQSYTFLTGCPLPAAEKTTMAGRSSKKKAKQTKHPFPPRAVFSTVAEA